MANKFQIVIAAVDKATAVVRKVNQSFSTLTRPVSEMKAVVSSFSKEAGLDKIGKSLADMGRAAGDAAGKLAGVATPLAAITGVSSIAGMTALAVEWAHVGSEIEKTSATIGTASNRLQTLRGAAALADVPVESLTSGLKSLGDTMEDALYGRNQQALVMMNQLGIRLHRTADGAVDTTRAFYDLADAIARQKKPQVQGLIARTFGLEEALPLLRKGSKAIAEFEKQVEATGNVMGKEALEKADSFRISMTLLGDALGGVKNAVGEDLAVFQPLVDTVREFIVENRSAISTVLEFAAGMMTLGTAAVFTARAFGFIGVALSATLVPALVSGALRAAVLFEGLAGMATGIPVVAAALSGLSSAFLAVGAAIEVTPIGWIITGIAAIAVGAYLLAKNWNAVKDAISGAASAVARFFHIGSGVGGGVVSVPVSTPAAAVAAPASMPDQSVSGPAVPTPYYVPPNAAAAAASRSSAGPTGFGGNGAAATTDESSLLKVIVAFENAPRGMKARIEKQGNAQADMMINYHMPAAVTP